MKKIFLILIILFFAVPAWGVTLAWDAYTDEADGFILYYQQTGETEIYSEVIQGSLTVIYTVEDSKFQPGQEYSFWLTAFNDMAESGSSNIVTWTAPTFIPTDNPAPVIINVPGAPSSVTINIGGQ